MSSSAVAPSQEKSIGPVAPSKAPGRAWRAMWAFPLYFLLLGLFSIIAAMLPDSATIAMGLTVAIIAAGVTVLLCYSSIFKAARLSGVAKKREGLGEILLLRRPTLKHALLGVNVGVATFIVLVIVNAIAMGLGATPESSDTSTFVLESSGTILIISAYIIVPFLAPLFEELFFRGLIFNNINKGLGNSRKSFWVATIFSAATFSLMHFQGFSTFSDFFVVAWIFALGLAYCFLAKISGSVWVSVIAHCVYNSISIGLGLLGQ